MSQLPISANLKNNKGDRQSRNERHTFVLVHGGWCGGWIWRYVAPALRERGHVATTPTLTGLGERRHSGNRTATLSTHIEDIVAHIEMDGFEDVILVSQSYGGRVATGTLACRPPSDHRSSRAQGTHTERALAGGFRLRLLYGAEKFWKSGDSG
jgi:pimeloyl-ACP methyl ester carboxylesterase